MRVTLICRDKPGALQVRLDNRAAHLAHIQTSGVVEMAGPFLDPEGKMTGSLIVLEVGSLQAAQDWADELLAVQVGTRHLELGSAGGPR
jgi:uncharacterized protein